MSLHPVSVRRPLFAAALLVVAVGSAAGQVKYPPRPETYHVDLRYSIQAGRDERIRQYREMMRNLGDLKFVADPREDADLDIFDPTAERLAGTIPSANATRLFDDPRVRTVLLVPAGTTLPEDPAKPVPVRIAIRSGLEPTEQRLLHGQVVAQLGRMGFRENVGYDHAGYTLVRGALPAGRVPELLKDLRDLPGGWFAADTPRDELPLPLRSVLPVRTVEVLPDVPGLTPPLPVTPVVGKVTPDLRNALADPAGQGRPIRVEVVLDRDLGDAVAALQVRLRDRLPGAVIEGAVGEIVAMRLPNAAAVDRIAQLGEVTAIRLPRAASLTVRPAVGGDATPGRVPASTRVGELHARGYRGVGTRVVVIGTDFPGWSGMVGQQLPKATRLIDLTAELSPTLEPAPAVANAPVTGIETALAVHAGAPDAELTLVRVDPAALHQLMTVARQASGEAGASIALQTRGIELTGEADDMVRRRDRVIEEYRQAFANLSDDEGPARRREAAQKAIADLRADEQALTAKIARFVALRRALDQLAGTAVVVNTLVWDQGYPNDGLSAVSRLIDERFVTKPTRTSLTAQRQAPVPVWVQAGSDSVGAVWAGPFLDADGNGVMEFAVEGAKPAAGLWTTELNFLGAEGADGKVGDLAAGTRLRFTIQWREPLPLDPAQPAPVFDPQLRLLRQLDPDGTKAASDEMTEAARSAGPPVRIQLNPSSAVYEQTLEVNIATAGRYALRVEGRTSATATLPGLSRAIEVQSRLSVQTLSPDAAGRAVFTTFAPKAVGVGVPADSSAALTIGYATGPDGATPGGLTGVGPGVTLRAKPDLIVPGVIVVNGKGVIGSGVAAGYAGGVSASLMGAGVRPTNLTRSFGVKPGGPLVIPPDWIQTLVPLPGSR